MGVVAPKALVPAPEGSPRTFGLFSVVSPVEDSTLRWENGVEWEDAAAADVRAVGQWTDAGSVPGLPKQFDDALTRVESLAPLTVYSSVRCSAVGMPQEDAERRATARLLVREEAAVERALWTGDPSLGKGLAAAAKPLTGTLSMEEAVDALEYYASRHGHRPVLHMSRRTASALTRRKALESPGSTFLRLTTRLGSPVVAGVGYPDVSTIVATGPLVAYRGPVLTSSSRDGDLLDRAKNNQHAVAERQYVVGFAAAWSYKIDFQPALPAVAGG